MDLHLITSVSGRQNHQKSQNFHFHFILYFFEHFKRTQDARSVFNFVIFDDFGSPGHQNLANLMTRIRVLDERSLTPLARFLP